jgi:hypothetical protein
MDKFTKQPHDIDTVDVSFVDYLTERGDTGQSVAVVITGPDSALTSPAASLVNGVAKVWLSGGTDGNTYKLTATLTTNAGRIKEHDFNVKIKEQ